MKIRKSAEDYLEMVLMLHEKKGYARAVDIAAQLGVSKPSVSLALKKLRENGYVAVDGDGLITLTAQGLEIASRMYKRHKLLASFLMALGVDEKTALEDACKLEHDLSEKSFNAICAHARGKAPQSGD